MYRKWIKSGKLHPSPTWILSLVNICVWIPLLCEIGKVYIKEGGKIRSEFDWPMNSIAWWRHQIKTFAALLAICTGNSPVPGEFPAQRPATRSFDVFFDLRLNKRLRKQPWGWWFETLSRPLWSQCNGFPSWVLMHQHHTVRCRYNAKSPKSSQYTPHSSPLIRTWWNF